jgi:hypothetical protein
MLKILKFDILRVPPIQISCKNGEKAILYCELHRRTNLPAHLASRRRSLPHANSKYSRYAFQFQHERSVRLLTKIPLVKNSFGKMYRRGPRIGVFLVKIHSVNCTKTNEKRVNSEISRKI